MVVWGFPPRRASPARFASRPLTSSTKGAFPSPPYHPWIPAPAVMTYRERGKDGGVGDDGVGNVEWFGDGLETCVIPFGSVARCVETRSGR